MKSANLVQIGKIVIDEHCPEPKLTSPEQTLVRVRYAAINADDYSAFAGYLGRVYNSQRLLHEFSGEIVALGPQAAAQGFAVGDHVGWSVTVGDKTTIILAGSEITSEIRKALLASENHEITLYMVWKQFAVVTNTITASSGANGSITPSGDVIVEEGEDQTFTIQAASGYEIEDVLVDGVSVGAVSSYTFQNVTAARTISATFKKSADTPTPPKPPVKPADPISPIWPILPTILNPQTTDSGISRWLDTVQPKAYPSQRSP